ASVRSVENALGLEIPLNAQLIRNIMISAHSLHDHIVHFYHLSALDWVDVTSALKADPDKAAALADKISNWPGNSPDALRAVKAKLESFVAAGQMGIFTNGYWGHPAMRLPPEVNLLAVAHYLQALDLQRKANQAVAILGSKTPNVQNLAVGGVANAINLDNPATLNMEKLYQVKTLLEEVQAFVQQCYFPDVAAIASFYPDWLKYGAGVTNYLAVPDLPLDAKMTKFDLPGGVIWNGDLSKAPRPVTSWNDDYLKQNITESIARSYYEGDWTKGIWDSETKPAPGEWNPDGRYSWVKSPRLEGKPVQVGPVAQILVGYLQGHERIQFWANKCLDVASSLAGTKLGPGVLQSTLGRHAARAIRAAVLSELALKHWNLLVENVGKGDTAIYVEPKFPKGEVRGVGFHEAPRGTLSHWCVVQDGKLKNYQAVVPSTWNASPRDAKDQMGPYEASLVGNPIADPKLPLEALRTIHSFDPCLACAIHTHDEDGAEVARVKVL
ncbi:MAG TPA: nickel-dependent hydrogenase large subunit, partial [Anaeromyxobacteraceae bacterium]|nr:nickel-dependent hydrogenase large subunit [Anaeromyxobacteraceae bacterium]